MPRPEDTRRADFLSPYLMAGGPFVGRARQVVGLRRDGTRFPMDLSVSEFDGDDGPQFTWILRDVTEQARLQEQLRQAQKMDAIGRLAGGVAHDFNNLLTVINGWCESLSSASADDRKAAVDQITSAAAKAANLTAQLLVLQPQERTRPLRRRSQPGHRRHRPHAAPRDRRRHPPRDRARGRAGVRHHRSGAAQPGARQPGARTPATRCRAAAASAWRPRGSSSARARPPQAAVASGAYISLTVSDTGTGIAAEALPHLFEPFFTTKADRGTGLGLATVQAIVHQAGGVIAAANLPEGGARFSILLPEAVPSRAPERTARPAPRRTGAAAKSCSWSRTTPRCGSSP